MFILLLKEQRRYSLESPIKCLPVLPTELGKRSGYRYFTCMQNMKFVTTIFKWGALYEKHVVATRDLGNHLCIWFYAQGNEEKPVSRWPVAGPSEY